MITAVNKQPQISKLFEKIINNNQLQHAYIFEGVAGTGKYEMAKWVAQAVNCQNPTETGAPCQQCSQCVRIEHEEHPDVIAIAPDGATIKVDQVRQIKDEFSRSGMESQRKILIIKEMDKMTPSAANSLLKFIEEPEGEITILLLTTEVQRLLPTIVSRCQLIHFPVRNVEDRITDVTERGIPHSAATVLVRLTQDTDVALEIYEDENFRTVMDTVWQWFLFLSKKDDQAFIYVQTNLMPLVDNRETSSLILDLLILIYRDLTAIYFEQERTLAFSKYEEKLENITATAIASEISRSLTIILEAKKKLNSYVAAQGIFEQIAIKLVEY